MSRIEFKYFFLIAFAVVFLTNKSFAQQLFSFPSIVIDSSQPLPKNLALRTSNSEVFLSAPTCDELQKISHEFYHWLEFGGREPNSPESTNCLLSSNSKNPYEINLSQIVTLKSVKNYQFYLSKLLIRLNNNFPKWPEVTVLKLDSKKIVLRAKNCLIGMSFLNEVHELSHAIGQETLSTANCIEVKSAEYYRFEIDVSKSIAPKLNAIMETASSDNMIVPGPNCFGTALYLLGLNSNLMSGGSIETGLFLKSNSCRQLQSDEKSQPGDVILFSNKADKSGTAGLDAAVVGLYKLPQHIAIYAGSGMVFEKASVQGYDRPQFNSLENDYQSYSIPLNCRQQNRVDSEQKLKQQKCSAYTEAYRCNIDQLKVETTPSSQSGQIAKNELDAWMQELNPLLMQSRQNCYVGMKEPLLPMIADLSKIRYNLLTALGSDKTMPNPKNRNELENFFWGNPERKALYSQYTRVISATRVLQNMLYCLDFKTLSADPLSPIVDLNLKSIDSLYSNLLWPSFTNTDTKPN